MVQPSVSVCLFTYNYETYLEKAIKSILDQQVDFGYEIVIGDDLSTDNTRGIAQGYHEKFPEIVKLSFNEQNIGGTRNWIKTMNTCSGKYIALLDGDDYFTDPKKLQKQFDCLEANAGAVMCFHAVEEIITGDKAESRVVHFDKARYTLEDFLSHGWFIRTSTTFFRNGLLPSDPPVWVYDFPYRYDTILHVFLGMKGFTIYLDEPMSVWLKHPKGMSIELFRDKLKNFYAELGLALKLNEFTGRIYNEGEKRYCKILNSDMFLFMLQQKRLFSDFSAVATMFIHADWKHIVKRLTKKFLK